jgi:antitoxin component YwqK of YwqJK toxin-antitoxin module
MLKKGLLWLTCPLVFAITGCADGSRTAAADDPELSLRQDSLYHHGQPFTGMVVSLRNPGDTISVGSWKNGVEDGRHKVWHTSGTPSEERYFVNGRKTGTHRGWFPDGNPSFVYEFTAGEHHGKAEEWYPNGQQYRIFNYNAGYEEGLQRMWREDGSLRANYAVRNGRRYGLIGLKLCRNPSDSLHP